MTKLHMVVPVKWVEGHDENHLRTVEGNAVLAWSGKDNKNLAPIEQRFGVIYLQGAAGSGGRAWGKTRADVVRVAAAIAGSTHIISSENIVSLAKEIVGAIDREFGPVDDKAEADDLTTLRAELDAAKARIEYLKTKLDRAEAEIPVLKHRAEQADDSNERLKSAIGWANNRSAELEAYKAGIEALPVLQYAEVTREYHVIGDRSPRYDLGKVRRGRFIPVGEKE